METLTKYLLVSRLEGLFQSVYFYFCRSSKRHAELHKLANLMETKGARMLRNVETRWISMRSPAQRILSEYKTLLMQMGLNMTTRPGHKPVAGAADIFDLFSDIEVVLSLACFIPLLNAVYSLMKLSQARDIFICDFLQVVKLCQQELARLFIDRETTYNSHDFTQYSEIVNVEGSNIPLRWQEISGDTTLCHLVFDLNGTTVWARSHDRIVGNYVFVTQPELYCAQESVERQFSSNVTLPSFIFWFSNFF